MPKHYSKKSRAARKNSIKNKPICKSAGLGGFLNSHLMKRCGNFNRVGLAQGHGKGRCTAVGKTGDANLKRPCGKN